MALSYNGSNLIARDDMDVSVTPGWGPGSSLSVTDLGAGTGPSKDFDGFEITSGAATSFLYYRGMSIPAGVQYADVWCRGGPDTDDYTTIEIGTYSTVDGFTTDSIEFIEGPGVLDRIAAGRAEISGLSPNQWTLVRITSTSMSVASDARLYIYPHNNTGQTVGKSIVVGPSGWTDSAGEGWVWDTPSPALPRAVRGRGLGMAAAAYAAVNVTPHSSIDLQRGQTWCMAAMRTADADMTLVEKREDGSNYLRIWVGSDGAFNADCVINGVNVGSATASGFFSKDTEYVIAVVIPETGPLQVYLDDQIATTGGGATVVSAGNGISCWSRPDGTQPWQGNIYGDVIVFGSAMSYYEIKTEYRNASSSGLLDPRFLRPGMVDSGGDLKPSLVNERYTGGAATSETLRQGMLTSTGELKPGLLDPDGTIKDAIEAR